MSSTLFGFVSGTAVGIFLSQNYEVPDMKQLIKSFKDSAKKLEKKPDGEAKKDS